MPENMTYRKHWWQVWRKRKPIYEWDGDVFRSKTGDELQADALLGAKAMGYPDEFMDWFRSFNVKKP